MDYRRPLTAALALLLIVTTAGCSSAPPEARPTPTAPLSATAPAAETVLAPASATPISPERATPPATPAPTPAAQVRALALQDPRLVGEDVRAAQQRLLDLGYAQLGEADGVFGLRTEAAVRAFQADAGLVVDGVIGPKTRAALFGAPGAAASVAPILYMLQDNSGYLLGGVRNNQWLDSATTAAALSGGEIYRSYSATRALGSSGGSAPASVGVPCEQTQQVELSSASAGAVVALGGDWEPLPRRAADAAGETEPYRVAVMTLLRSEGIAQPDVRFVQALRVDLEGDGVDEILLVATRLAEQRTTIAAGDYSMVLLARPQDPSRVLKLVGESYAQAADFGASVEYRIGGLLDLNGDGVLELVIEWSYYEGSGARVLEITGSTSRDVLSVGCGA